MKEECGKKKYTKLPFEREIFNVGVFELPRGMFELFALVKKCKSNDTTVFNND